ncbi:hypothetical protein [Spongiivirga citrea]|uniref:DUF922 domain-containing protein n=1 Tax=Spongiivirga citrea TaxID=1481457 RepID=A0A6M0CRC5_9FLAO|nr:hypothetical protein [Spongiivirga citrea]NER18409.1 hypothetical protein [Spongiivirga citrea]
MNEIIFGILFILVYFSPVFYQLHKIIKENPEKRKLKIRGLIKVLKITLVSFTVIAAVFLSLQHTNWLDYEKPIPFKNFNDISFKNFRGLEFFKKTLYGSKRFAYIRTDIETDIGDDQVYVESFFHPSKSFVYAKNNNDKYLLQHELYHFRITELFARKIKQEIDTTSIKSKTRINQIILKHFDSLGNYQKSYDYDTFHSYVLKEQRKYEKEVDSLLLLLNKYKKSNIVINESN